MMKTQTNKYFIRKIASWIVRGDACQFAKFQLFVSRMTVVWLFPFPQRDVMSLLWDSYAYLLAPVLAYLHLFKSLVFHICYKSAKEPVLLIFLTMCNWLTGFFYVALKVRTWREVQLPDNRKSIVSSFVSGNSFESADLPENEK